MSRRALLLMVTLVLSLPFAAADEKELSGPQVGEKLPSFKVKGVYAAAGKELDFVKQAAGKPTLLVFVHDANRPSIGLTRVLMNYALTRSKDGLNSGVVWLAKDTTEAEGTLKKIRHAMAEKAPTGISVDGEEGPGSYGLNRKMTLTILVANKGKVTANFALVQPSMEPDLPKVLKAIVKEVGGKEPKLSDLPGAVAKRPDAKGRDEKLPNLLRAVIQLKATDKEVDKAAAAVEAHIKTNEAAKKEVGRITRTIVGAGKVENYGTKKAQEYIRRWAKKYGGEAKAKEKEKAKDKGKEQRRGEKP
jgi:hypothetical protein